MWAALAPASWREPATPFWGGRVQSGHWHFDLVLLVTTRLVVLVILPFFEPRLGPALQSGCPSSGDARPGRVLLGPV